MNRTIDVTYHMCNLIKCLEALNFPTNIPKNSQPKPKKKTQIIYRKHNHYLFIFQLPQTLTKVTQSNGGGLIKMLKMMMMMNLQALQSHPTGSPLPETLHHHLLLILGLNGPPHHRQRRVQIHNIDPTLLSVTQTSRPRTRTPISTLRRRRRPPPPTVSGASAGEWGWSEVFAGEELFQFGVLDNIIVAIVVVVGE